MPSKDCLISHLTCLVNVPYPGKLQHRENCKISEEGTFLRIHKVNCHLNVHNFFTLLTSSQQVFRMFICNSACMHTVSLTVLVDGCGSNTLLLTVPDESLLQPLLASAHQHCLCDIHELAAA